MTEIAAAVSVAVSALSTIFCSMTVFYLQRRQKKADERRAEAERRQKEEQKARDERRKRFELLQIRATLASMGLSEAAATALKNGHTNGETERALSYERDVKREMREFLEEQGVGSVLE